MASFGSGSHLISLVTPLDNLVVSIFVQVGSNDYIFWGWALYIVANQFGSLATLG
jgi:hypothetical protein